jgi:hypothetical protein
MSQSEFQKVASLKALNLLWIYPEFLSGDKEYFQPIPDKTIENIFFVCGQNPAIDVRLWIDKQRLTLQQINFIKSLEELCPSKNLIVRDLREISAYASEPLFNKSDSSSDWRWNKHSLIWQQVDAARILACLDGSYDQSFYADADITNLKIENQIIQSIMRNHGLILAGGVGSTGYAWYENQMFGFTPTHRDFFEALYKRSLEDAYTHKQNGYGAFIDLINEIVKTQKQIDTKEIVFSVKHDGTFAHHNKKPILQSEKAFEIK